MIPDDLIYLILSNLSLHEILRIIEIFKLPKGQELLKQLWAKRVKYNKRCGNEEYTVDNRLWRYDGPAFIGPDVIAWYVNGMYHREDGPAVITSKGIETWYYYGTKHRNGGPAYISPSSEIWYYYGRIHREDGPAETDCTGMLRYMRYGIRHRKDGPAIIFANGDMEWWFNGELHREDGPAIDWKRKKEWWINGKKIK